MNEGLGPGAGGRGHDAQLRVLASAILYRACLRALAPSSAQGPKPSAQAKMELHARVEEAAWALPEAMLREVEDRDVDDGPPEGDAWRDLVRRLVAA